MNCTASFRSIEEVNSLLQRDTRMINLQQGYLMFIGHKKCDIELFLLAKELLSNITNCQYYIENKLSSDKDLKRKEKDIIYMRALSLISSAIDALKKRLAELRKLSIGNTQEHKSVLDQISKI